MTLALLSLALLSLISAVFTDDRDAVDNRLAAGVLLFACAVVWAGLTVAR